MASPTPDREPELLETISQRDASIAELENRIQQLQSSLAEASTPAAMAPESGVKAEQLEASLQETQARLQDYLRRAETAAEVSDSVISDLAELMSQVEASGMDPSAKHSVVNLIKNVGRAIGRVSAQSLIDKHFRITRDRGQWYTFMDTPVMPTYHPAYLLRYPQAKRQVWQDVQEIMKRMGLANPRRVKN